MEIKDEFNFSDLQNKCWQGASDTLQTISEHNKEDEFMSYLASVFECGDIPTMTQVNDFIWFERDTICSDLGINENDDDDCDDENDDCEGDY